MSARASVGMDLTRFVTRAINLKNTGSTDLVASLRTSTQRFVVTAIYIHYTTATAITVNPTLDVHVNGGSGNVVASAILSGTIATNNVLSLPLVTPVLAGGIGASQSAIVLNVSVGATGTTLTADVHVLGFYV